jgi:hypothetical protein
LKGTLTYFPVLQDVFITALGSDDEIPPRSKADWTIAASFDAPLATVDTRKQVTVKIEDATGAAAEFTGK